MEHLAEPAITRRLYGFLCIFGIQLIYGKSSLSSFGSIPKEVRTHWRLSSTSDAEKSVRLYVGFSGSELRYPMYKWAIFMPGKVLITIYFLKGNNVDNSNLIFLGLEKQSGITLKA